MKTKHFLTGILALTFVPDQPILAAAFVPGEILVNEYNSSSVQRYSADGTLLQTFTGTGTSFSWAGASLTPDGNLVSSYHGPNTGLQIFSPGGTQIANNVFSAFSSLPSDVSVFPNGTLAYTDLNLNNVWLFSQAGVLLNIVNMPGLRTPHGSTVGSDGILYVAGYGSLNLARVDASGNFLGLIGLDIAPGDLVMNPVDSTLWVTSENGSIIEHLQTDGTVLGAFSPHLRFGGRCDGIGLAPDNNSLYVTNDLSAVVEHVDFSGNLLGSFALTSPNHPKYLTVVPAAAPEPGSAALLLGGCALLAARRRRRA